MSWFVLMWLRCLFFAAIAFGHLAHIALKTGESAAFGQGVDRCLANSLGLDCAHALGPARRGQNARRRLN